MLLWSFEVGYSPLALTHAVRRQHMHNGIWIDVTLLINSSEYYIYDNIS